ncbi:MAG: hypothetical protein WBB74_00440 [Gaiellaceae bacterium]
MTRRVLITDGDERSVLAACRGLSAADYAVSVAATRRPAAAHWSRSCAERLFVPDVRCDLDGFVEALVAILRRGDFAALIPGTEAVLLAVSEHREALEQYTRLGLPPPAVVDKSLDKGTLVREAAAAGLEQPATVSCDHVRAASAAARELGFPLVVKPGRSVLRSEGRMRQQALAIVTDERKLVRAVAEMVPPFLLQRFAATRHPISCGGVMTGDGLVAAAVSRYRRMWPPPAGSVTFSESVIPPEPLLERIEALLGAIGWHGIFEVELLELEPGRLAAVDLNPRVYGSLALAVRGGANLPAIWCDRLLGRERPRARGAAGLRYRWEDGDLKHLLWQLRRGRVSAAAAVLVPRRRVAHAYFELRDPAPIVARFLFLARTLPIRFRDRLRGP